MSGKYSRTKGHNFERSIANKFKELYPRAQRGLQTQNKNIPVPDVANTEFWIECKCGATPNIFNAYLQALRDRHHRVNAIDPLITGGKIKNILVITKKDRFDPVLVTLSLEDFFQLLYERMAEDDISLETNQEN